MFLWKFFAYKNASKKVDHTYWADSKDFMIEGAILLSASKIFACLWKSWGIVDYQVGKVFKMLLDFEFVKSTFVPNYKFFSELEGKKY